MESIIDYLQWVADMWATVFEMVVNFFKSLISFFKILPTVLTFITSSIVNLPEAVYLFAFITVVVAVVLLVLGRSNN